MQPRHLELSSGNKTANLAMWSVVSHLMEQIEKADSPKSKLKFLSSAMVSICATFSLSFPGKDKKATTDDFIPSLVLVLLRTQLECPVATHKYLQYFASTGEGSGYEAQHRVFFESCTNFILNELSMESLALNEEEKSNLCSSINRKDNECNFLDDELL